MYLRKVLSESNQPDEESAIFAIMNSIGIKKSSANPMNTSPDFKNLLARISLLVDCISENARIFLESTLVNYQKPIDITIPYFFEPEGLGKLNYNLTVKNGIYILTIENIASIIKNVDQLTVRTTALGKYKIMRSTETTKESFSINHPGELDCFIKGTQTKDFKNIINISMEIIRQSLIPEAKDIIKKLNDICKNTHLALCSANASTEIKKTGMKNSEVKNDIMKEIAKIEKIIAYVNGHSGLYTLSNFSMLTAFNEIQQWLSEIKEILKQI